MKVVSKGLSGTFVPNKSEPIHRWYKYAEGYSSNFIERELDILPGEVQTLFEPFGGSGTTLLVAAERGIESYFTEINPFMVFVSETKINTVLEANRDKEQVLINLQSIYNSIDDTNSLLEFHLDDSNGLEKYFDAEVLKKLYFIKNNIIKLSNNSEPTRRLGFLALASIAITVSNMVKRGDLRYAKDGEKKASDFEVFTHFKNKLSEVMEDVLNYSDSLSSNTHFLDPDARQAYIGKKVDCVITSPPYLNGTNYIRNTKLELMLLDFINDDVDIPSLHSKGIMAGINSVSRRRHIPEITEHVKPYLEKLEPVAYDRRIPIMVAGYFYDMERVIKRLSELIKNNGFFTMDIGDSQFAGVHIPTHDILASIAKEYGFKLYEEETLRTRRSKNNMLLSQKVLRFQLILDE